MKIFSPRAKSNILTACAGLLLWGSLSACQDELSTQGSSLVAGEASITVDSTEYQIESHSVLNTDFDARAMTKLLGRIALPEYGTLDCSFLCSMMPTASLSIPDSITEAHIDSMRMIIAIPRGALTGDSLVPQQLQVYKLNRTLPVNVPSNVDPSEYCTLNADNLLGTRSYTLSAIAGNDTTFLQDKTLRIPVMMKKEMAVEYFKTFRDHPEYLQWPATFAEKVFPGIYVRQNFGNGCIASIAQVRFFLYWNRTDREYTKNEESGEYELTDVIRRDSVCLMAAQPEVVSSNVVNYNISDHLKNLVAQGKTIVTTPGGYYADIVFPADKIIEEYKSANNTMSVISKLSFEIPAEPIANDFNVGVVPYLLMVKKSEREEFFNKNKIPDNLTSFYATWDSASGTYTFKGLRKYILGIIESGKEPTAEDMEFSLIPVLISTETESNTYYGNSSTYVVKCSHYLGKPTMTLLHTDRANITFTFSQQVID